MRTSEQGQGLPSPQPDLGADRASEVLARLRTLIEGGYQKGMKLPPERALAAQLGVGRPALREAIKALSILDVLESRRGDGTYVKTCEPLERRWPEHVELEPASFSMLDLLEVRKMIEPRAAWLAAARGSERHLRSIEAARRALEANDQDWRRVAALDWELHSTIMQAAQNPVLEFVNRTLAPLMMESRRITARTDDRSRMHVDHARIVTAILRGQSEEAERAMLEHLQTVGLDLISEIRR
jgi:DNA-binding FadR family transcriptional regulator